MLTCLIQEKIWYTEKGSLPVSLANRAARALTVTSRLIRRSYFVCRRHKQISNEITARVRRPMAAATPHNPVVRCFCRDAICSTRARTSGPTIMSENGGNERISWWTKQRVIQTIYPTFLVPRPDYYRRTRLLPTEGVPPSVTRPSTACYWFSLLYWLCKFLFCQSESQQTTIFEEC